MNYHPIRMVASFTKPDRPCEVVVTTVPDTGRATGTPVAASNVTYRRLTPVDVAPVVLEQLNSLLSQLSTSAAPMSRDDLWRLLQEQTTTRVFAAFDGDCIVGVVLLTWNRILVGTKFWIEDVVVDERYRGRGICSKLMDQAEAAAREMGATKLDLTSRPARGSARGLYGVRGYEPRDTTVFRLMLK